MIPRCNSAPHTLGRRCNRSNLENEWQDHELFTSTHDYSSRENWLSSSLEEITLAVTRQGWAKQSRLFRRGSFCRKHNGERRSRLPIAFALLIFVRSVSVVRKSHESEARDGNAG
jgi:hypothetical protein